MISKKRRFNILERDHFRCQYCGAHSPEVRLEVDHIQPSSRGGEDEDWNLLTSCEACNRGKRDHPVNASWTAGKQNLLASGDALFRPFAEIVKSEDEAYRSFCDFRDQRAEGRGL